MNIFSALTMTTPIILLASLVSLFSGAAIAWLYQFRHRTATRSMTVMLILLPLIVQSIVLLMSDSIGIGTGIAIAGAFTLIRFRSVPGSSRDLLCVILAAAVGLANGEGCLLYAVFLLVLAAVVLLILSATRIGQRDRLERELKITIPESLEYNGAFDDLFELYTQGQPELISVRTQNLGSLYKLTYRLTLKDPATEKEFIDQLRCRNGNLDIVCGHASSICEEL